MKLTFLQESQSPSSAAANSTYMPSARTCVKIAAIGAIAATAAYYIFGHRDLSSSQPEICKPGSFLGMDDVPFFSGKVCVSIKDLIHSQPIAKTATAAVNVVTQQLATNLTSIANTTLSAAGNLTQTLSAATTTSISEHANMCFESIGNATISAAQSLVQTAANATQQLATNLTSIANTTLSAAGNLAQVAANATQQLGTCLAETFTNATMAALSTEKPQTCPLAAETSAKESTLRFAGKVLAVTAALTPYFAYRCRKQNQQPATENERREEAQPSSSNDDFIVEVKQELAAPAQEQQVEEQPAPASPVQETAPLPSTDDVKQEPAVASDAQESVLPSAEETQAPLSPRSFSSLAFLLTTMDTAIIPSTDQSQEETQPPLLNSDEQPSSPPVAQEDTGKSKEALAFDNTAPERPLEVKELSTGKKKKKGKNPIPANSLNSAPEMKNTDKDRRKREFDFLNLLATLTLINQPTTGAAAPRQTAPATPAALKKKALPPIAATPIRVKQPKNRNNFPRITHSRRK